MPDEMKLASRTAILGDMVAGPPNNTSTVVDERRKPNLGYQPIVADNSDESTAR